MSRRSLTSRSSGAAAAELARLNLRRAGRALWRMREGDPEGLHDTRVALRRLDALLRRRREQLPGAAALRPELRELARASNEARDLEVRLAWVEAQLSSLTVAERDGLDSWLVRLRQQLERAHAEAGRRFCCELPGLEKRIKKSLAEGQGEHGGPYAELLASDLKAGHRRLGRRLEALEEGAEAALHRLRIEAKRQRYLLAPWRGTKGPLAALEGLLCHWQTRLGEWRDLGLIHEALEAAQQEAEEGDERHALASLLRRCSEEQASLALQMADDFGARAEADLKRLSREARAQLKKEK